MEKSLVLKEEFAENQIFLYTYKGKLEDKLVTHNAKKSAFNIKLSRKMNEVPTLEFDFPFCKDSKLDLQTSSEKILRYRDWYYIIKDIEVDSSTLTTHVKAYGEEEELKYCYCNCLNEIGKTVKQCFESILKATKLPNEINYKFLGTDIPDTKMRHLITEDECSVYENIMSICDVFQCWVEFKNDENGQKGIFFRSETIKDNKILKNGIDLKELKISYNTENVFTRLIPYGANDEVTGNPLNIIEVNPTGKSYLENTAYYYGILGIPDEVILKEPKYQNIKTWTDDTIIDKKYLMEMGQQELDKCCFPELEASLTVRNLYKLLDSCDIQFKIGQEVIAINRDLDFRIQFRVTGIDEDSSDILNDVITISNKINIDTRFQNLQHTSNTLDKITNKNPYDTDGNIVGDDDIYLDMNKLKDGDHWNQLWVNEKLQSLATQTYDRIALRVEELEKSYAQINMTTNSIISTVSSMEDNLQESKSEIAQFSDRIDIKASKGEMGSLIEINPESVMLSWNQNNRYCKVDDSEGLMLGDRNGDTYSKVGYDGRLEFKMKGLEKRYHCLMFSGMEENIYCDNGGDYKAVNIQLPSMFDGIDKSEIWVSCSVAKFNREGFCVPYWMGAYAYINPSSPERIFTLYCMSRWRDIKTTTVVGDIDQGDSGISCDYSTVLSDMSEPRPGYLNVQYTIIA